ncbi:hypothetical protein VN1220_11940 [Helicobacter pylori]
MVALVLVGVIVTQKIACPNLVNLKLVGAILKALKSQSLKMVFCFSGHLTQEIQAHIKSILNEVGFVIARPLDYEIALNDLTNYFEVCVRPRPKLPSTNTTTSC